MRASSRIATALLACCIGCTPPEEIAGPGDLGDDLGDIDDDDNDDDDDDGPPLDPSVTFAISASPVDPYVQAAAPASGTYDLYLWMLCSNAGLSMLQANPSVERDALIGEGFSPDPGVVGIDWDEYGDFIVSMQSCTAGARRLGTFHLLGEGEGVVFALDLEASRGRATFCGVAEPVPYESLGFSSDGSEPPVVGSEDGCLAGARILARSCHAIAEIGGGAN